MLSFGRFNVAVAFSVAVLLTVLGAARTNWGSLQQTPALATRHSSPLVISPEPVDLGVLKPKQPAKRMLSVRNATEEPHSLQQLDASCPCVRFTGLPIRLGPNEAGAVEVVFDPSHDPDFRGVLAVDVTGRTRDGRIVLRTTVGVAVRDYTAPSIFLHDLCVGFPGRS